MYRGRIILAATAAMGTLALTGGLLATAGSPAPAAHKTAAAATFNSPIGPITEAENTWLHTHPVNMTQYRSDATYRAIILGKPAMKATAVLDSRLTWWGYFCAHQDGQQCINTWGGGPGGDVFFGSGIYKNANGEFNQWYYGATGISWPIPSLYFYRAFPRASVYQYCFAPGGRGKSLCLDQGAGPGKVIKLQHSLPNARQQFWVWTSHNRWVAVLWTGSSFLTYENHGITYWAGATLRQNGHPIYMTTNASASLAWTAYHGG